MLKAGAKWHGFGDLAEGFNLLDPIKSTIITPGLDMSGKFAKSGIPASIVTKFLAEHGVVVEKTGLYSFFIMFTIGITKGRWNTMVTELQQFKDDYDQNQPLWRVLPEFIRAQPRYVVPDLLAAGISDYAGTPRLEPEARLAIPDDFHALTSRLVDTRRIILHRTVEGKRTGLAWATSAAEGTAGCSVAGSVEREGGRHKKPLWPGQVRI